MEFKLSAEASELVALKRKMEPLLADPNFKAYAEILQGQLTNWRQRVEEPCLGMDAVFMSEFNKGTLFGIRLILDLPHRIIREAQDIVSRQEKMNDRPTFTKPGESIDSRTFGVPGERADARFHDTPESIAEQLGEPVGPNARVTADSNG